MLVNKNKLKSIAQNRRWTAWKTKMKFVQSKKMIATTRNEKVEFVQSENGRTDRRE